MKSRPSPLWGRLFRRQPGRRVCGLNRQYAACAWFAMLIVFLGLLCAGLLSAQTAGVGSLRGTVVDPSGGAVPNATVQAASATGEMSRATTNATGAYQLNNLAAGPYTVDVTVTGFAPYKKENVAVVANRPLQLDISLEIAQQKEEVTVAGETLAVNTSPSNNAGAVVLTDKELDALPDTIPTNCKTTWKRWPGPPPDPMAGRCTSTDLPRANFRRNRRFAKSASIRIHFQRNMTSPDSAGLKSSRNPARMRGTGRSSSMKTRRSLIPGIPSPAAPATLIRHK